MGMKFAKNAVKIGFVDNQIQQGTPTQPFFGYFADSERTIEERKDTYFRLAAEENCFAEPVYIDDTVVSNPSNPVPVENFPTNTELTTPPKTMELLDSPLAQAAVLGIGVYLFIKLVS